MAKGAGVLFFRNEGVRLRRRGQGLSLQGKSTGDGELKLRAELAQRTGELEEARGREAATAEILKVISSSPGQLDVAFEAILANATRFCDAKFGTLFLRDGDAFRIGAQHNTPKALADLLQSGPLRNA